MITPKVEDFINDAAQIHWHHEMPLPSISMFLEWSVMRTAKEMGNTVMLDGQGSDELLGGYPYYFPQYQKEAFFHGQFYNLVRNTSLFRSSLMRETKKYPDYERRINLNTFLNLRKTLSICLKEAIKFLIQEKWVSKKIDNTFSFIEPFKKQISDGLQFTVLQEQLHSADRNGMAFGIETRFPFLDHKLVDYCIKLSRNLLVHDGYQKYILRKALEGLIPGEINSRSDKLGFQAPQDKWIMGPLAPWIQERVNEPFVKKIPFYTSGNQPQDNTNSQSLNWRWASLAEWLSVYDFKII
jgi:asparagine synthase (glutamine-hydrolysing)